MMRVLAFGTFDVLHAGHLHYLVNAKEMGDELIVVVARDETVESLKGKRPIFSQTHRLALVAALKPVDKAVLGNDYFEDRTRVVKELKPDTIVLGYDQRIDEKELEKELKVEGWKGKIMRAEPFLPEKLKSGKIKDRIRG